MGGWEGELLSIPKTFGSKKEILDKERREK